VDAEPKGCAELAMSDSSLPLARRSRSILYGVAFFALGLLFFLFAGLDFAQDGEQPRGMTTRVWIGVAFLSVGSALLLWARHRAKVQISILESGLPAQAVITAIRDVSVSSGSGGTLFTEVEYRYEPSPGQMHKGKSGLLTIEETRGWDVGEVGTVKFDAADPAQSVWIGLRAGELPPPQSPPSLLTLAKRAPAFWFECSLGIVFAFFSWLGLPLHLSHDIQSLIGEVGVLLAGALLLFLGLRNLMIWRLVLKDGVSAEGAVTAVKMGFLPVRSITEWQRVVHYTYADSAGRHHHGDSGYLSRLEASGWSAGDKCSIRFAQDAPHRSIWIGRIGRTRES
jgi:hypothetical protein